MDIEIDVIAEFLAEGAEQKRKEISLSFPPEKPLFRPVPRKSRTNPALYLWNFCKILFFFTFALYNKVCTMRPESEPGGMPVFQQEELYFEKDHHKGGLPALRRCAGAGRSRLLQVR